MISILNPPMENSNDEQQSLTLGRVVVYVAAALFAGGGGGAVIGSSYGAANVSRDPQLERRLTLIESRLESLAKTTERVEKRLDLFAENYQGQSQKKGR